MSLDLRRMLLAAPDAPAACRTRRPALQPGRVWERVVDTSMQPPDDALLEGGQPIRWGGGAAPLLGAAGVVGRMQAVAL